MQLSDAWAAGISSLDFTVPDLSGLAGFDARIGPQAGQPVSMSIRRDEATSPDIVEGARFAHASSTWICDDSCAIIR